LSDLSAPVSRSVRHRWVVLVVAVAVIAIDQITKSLALAHLGPGPTHLFGPFGFELTYNTGSAFSLFQGSSAPLFFLDVALVVVLLWVAFRSTSLLLQIGAGLIVGGALGNMVDRIARHHGGGVVDFITLSHWPTFNGADSAITIGSILIVISLLRDSGKHTEASEAT